MRSKENLLDTKDKLKEWIRRDRISSGYPATISIKEYVIGLIAPNYIMRFERLLRIVEYIYNSKTGIFWKIVLFILRIRLRKMQVRLGFTIPINVFGPGLAIAHYGNIVVSQNASIGDNCRIHSGVNIGSSGGDDAAPIIGDNVYIGPGAILFGDIIIGNGVLIGANATVNKSFEENNVVIAGTPARIVKEHASTWNS